MAARDGEDRFGTIMLPHMDAAYSLARYLTRDRSAAEDIVQEGYLRAYRSFAGWRGDNPRAWLLMIVRRCFLDAVSRAKARCETDDDAISLEETEIADPEAAFAERRRAMLVRAAVEALPGSYREAIVLREFEELSYREIADIVGVPIGTVMSRLSRARQMLAQRLAPLTREEPEPADRAVLLES